MAGAVASLLLAAHVLAVAAFVVRLLSRDDMLPSSRLAWSITLVLLPYVGVAFYLLIGERRLPRSFFARYRAIGARASIGPAIAPPNPAFALATGIGGFPTTAGNTGALLADEAATIARLVADIDAARRSLSILFYIWLPDRNGTAVAEAVIRAAARGVRCRVMADAIGSRALIRSPLWTAMAQAGAGLHEAMPLRNLLMALLGERIDLRNHRKIAVVDGRIGYCGSQNCADPEFLPKARFGPWVDIMLRLEGPVVGQMERLFEDDFVAQGGGPLDAPPREAPAEPAEGGFAAQMVGTGPTARRGTAARLFSRLIFEARRELVVTTPYFVPDEPVLSALCAAAGSGVAVTLILPRRNDSRIVAFASRSHYGRLLRAGVRIFEFEGGLLHAKTLTIDGATTFMGSSNLDIRSFDLNFENDVLFMDRVLTAAVRARQQAYAAASREMTLGEVEAWPLWRRIANNALATVSPIL